MPRPKTHDDALRRRLLERAGELLSTEGPAAVSLRKIATDVNTSTTAVYSLFGGKPALLEALYDEAFHRFGTHLAAVPVTFASGSRMTFPFTATADFTRAPRRRTTSPSRARTSSRDSPGSTTTVFPRLTRSRGPAVTTHSSARAGTETRTDRKTRSGRITGDLRARSATRRRASGEAISRT